MLNLNWDAPATILSAYGSVAINSVTGTPLTSGTYPLFRTIPDGYQIVPAKFRPTGFSLSQADGSTLQPPYIDGMVASMTLRYWVSPSSSSEAGAVPACRDDLLEMNEQMMGVLNALRTYPGAPVDSLYQWQPPGGGNARQIESVMLAAWPEPDFSQQPEVRVKLMLASPYPYAIDDEITDIVIDAGDSDSCENYGNISYQPIIRINGPVTDTCVVVNETTGLEIYYDVGLPGASEIASGHYVEVDTFMGTAYLDGNPDNNYIAGLDLSITDFFPLLPQALGNNDIQVIGGTSATVLTTNSWC